jgi:DNA-binding NarL/FixJ family response regulator
MVMNLRNPASDLPGSYRSRPMNAEPTRPNSVDSAATASAPLSGKTIVVIDQRVLMRDCLVRCLRATSENSAVHAFASVAEWLQGAARHPPAGVIVLCNHGCKNANAQTERDLLLLSRSGLGVPAVILADAEGLEHVVAALEGGARGYIPTSVTLDVAVEAMRFVGAGGTFVPASSLISSSIAGDSGAAQKRQFNGMFTRRQTAVLEALRHGKANKEIAYELNMREGTVKVHVRNIMKKLKAKNRTEVAVLTSGLLAEADGG